MARCATSLMLGIMMALLPMRAHALDPPHDASNDVSCDDCHALRAGGTTGWGILPRGAVQEAMCKSCHNPTGKASGMTEVSNHIVGGMEVDCGSCHDPHRRHTTTDTHPGGQTAQNLRLIRGDTGKYIGSGALEPALFQQRPSHFAFDEASPPWNGICQSCHTATDHHRNDGTADHSHQVGLGCTTCHPHEAGFLPQGGCSDCHAQPQGSRRQIVGAGGDFERTSHHVRGTVDDSDCTVCHYVGDHQSGTVKLKDPDQGDTQIYDYSPADPAGLETFCVNCHDADGASAGGGTDPFGDGRIVPDVEGEPGSRWVDSAHRQIGYAPNGGNPVSCLGDGATTGCHSNAHGSDNEKLISAAAGVTLDEFCYNCHTEGGVQNDAISNNRPGGYVSADDIEEAFAKSTKHDLDTAFTANGNTYLIQCTTCHNPHVVTGQHWEVDQGYSPVTRPDLTADPATNPRAMGNTLWGARPGEKMDDFAALASGSGGWYYSTARGGTISIDRSAVYQPPKAGSGYEFEFGGDVLPDYTTLCLDCHSHRMSAANPPVNWGQGIPCTDNSVDPPNQRVECGADHGLGMAGKPLYISDNGTPGFWGSSGNPDVIFHMNYVTRGRHNGHFMRWPYDSAERSAGINFVMSCTDCHEAHGSNRGGIVRERFNVNANGDCGTGGNTNPDGENCADGGNWNSFCNACHYYYGGQHAGMSCGNASCHEANSIHRIIHVTDSGASTQLMLTAAGYESSYQRPDFTPEITSVEGVVGSYQLIVTFASGVYASSDLAGGLSPGDFWLFDVNGDNPRTITAVTHTAGESTAVLTMSAALSAADHGVDHITTTGKSVWSWYEGGYVNAATGVIGAQAVSAGPWPVTIAGCPVDGAVTFELNEPAGSATCTDSSGLLSGPVGVPAFSFPGDNTFHGDEGLGTFIDIDSHPACLNSPRAVTIEARVRPTEVDRGVGDNTFNRVFERRRTILVTILNTDYRGDDVPERYGKASIEVKYRVDTASRHTCPHPQWPDDPYEGVDARMHQISSNIDQWPIVNDHWYQVKIVFNSDKLDIPGSDGTPVDIFIDDEGTDGLNSPNPTPGDPGQNPDYEQWQGYVNASQTINESSSCKWGALPGDFIEFRDDTSHIGSSWSHSQVFEGQIDWITWQPVADYSGVDDPPY